MAINLKKAGGAFLTAKVKNALDIQKALGNIAKEAALVEKYTIRDIKKGAVVAVKQATSKVYAINQNEVARAQYKTPSKYAGMQHVSTSFKGAKLEDMIMVFRGKKTATWNTKAKPKPKPTKTGNPKVFSTQKKYTVTQEVFRGKRVTIQPRGDHRAFVAMIGGKLRPMVVGKNNKPLVKASTSVPQAILNPDVVAIWKPDIQRRIEKSFKHHTRQYWAGNIDSYNK